MKTHGYFTTHHTNITHNYVMFIRLRKSGLVLLTEKDTSSSYN